MNDKTVGNRIITALETNNITRKHIVEETGISKGALSDYINDNRIPNLTNTLALARALHVSPSWLAWGLGEMKEI